MVCLRSFTSKSRGRCISSCSPSFGLSLQDVVFLHCFLRLGPILVLLPECVWVQCEHRASYIGSFWFGCGSLIQAGDFQWPMRQAIKPSSVEQQTGCFPKETILFSRGHVSFVWDLEKMLLSVPPLFCPKHEGCQDVGPSEYVRCRGGWVLENGRCTACMDIPWRDPDGRNCFALTREECSSKRCLESK